MEENEFFYVAIKQKKILEKIMSFLSFRDGYNFSLTCKCALESAKNIKKKGYIYFDNEDYKANLYIRSPEDIIISKVEYKEFRSEMSCPANRLNVTVDFDEKEPNKSIMINIGKKLNELLMVNQTIQKLNFHFEINFSCDYYIGHLISEIESDRFSRLEISIFISSWVDMNKFNIPYFNDNIFDGFKNLKEIEMEVKGLYSNGIFNKLVDAASNIKGVVIKTSLRNDKQIELPNYTLSKKVLLSIVKSNYNLRNLNLWFDKLDITQLSYIQKLRINVKSLIEIYKFSNYLSYMTNLEWLRIVFYIDEFELKNNNNIESKIHEYTPSKHLKKLKTLKIEFYYNFSFYNENNDTKNNLFLEILNDSFKKDNEEMKERTIICSKKMLNFLSILPICIENLCFCKIPELTCEMTKLLNDYFPNLSFLHLEMIGKTESECLKNFKNLKYYVSCSVDSLELPKSIRASMVQYGSLWYPKVFSKEKNTKCCEYYRGLRYFTKECILHGTIKGEIFINYFHDLFSIKSHLDDMS